MPGPQSDAWGAHLTDLLMPLALKISAEPTSDSRGRCLSLSGVSLGAGLSRGQSRSAMGDPVLLIGFKRCSGSTEQGALY